MNNPIPMTMTRDAFRAWAANLPKGVRCERVGGFPVSIGPASAGHTRVKARMWRAMEAALKKAGSSCEALIGGITVEIGDDADYEPDVIIHSSPLLPDDVFTAPLPIIIVEIVSPGACRTDTGCKLVDYFRLPSLRHYLVIRADRKSVILHSRDNDGRISTSIHTEGEIALTPPGMKLQLANFFER